MTEEQLDKVLCTAMRQYVENSVESVEELVETDAEVEFSDRFKRRINLLFREKVGTKRAMHPEADNCFERTRSRIIRAELIVIDKVKSVFKRGNPT